MGHIRDLPRSAKEIPAKFKKHSWASLGVNVDQGFDPIYCVPKDKLKVVSSLREKLEEASELYLATDEDREGESISWHLAEVLEPNVPMKRMVFNEITQEAIEGALRDTREIDMNLVRAQEARRILDRLVGYSISPLLWKKVAYGLSAGRVQSVAVRLVSEKELARLRFQRAGYWGLTSKLSHLGQDFEARLTHLGKKRVATGKDFDGETGELRNKSEVLVLQKAEAEKLQASLVRGKFVVRSVEERPVQRKPYPPFITSTLQQEANRKLGLGSRETMQVAQKLYEQGFITYMRTDSTFLSDEALKAARSCIQEKYGKDYLPPAPRSYAGKKVKGAQEAHEAIRPAGRKFQDPDATGLTGRQAELYELIWKRTVASQMVDARQRQVAAVLEVDDSLFQANGMTLEFPGFLRAYVEGSDDPDAELEEREVRLPKLAVKDSILAKKIEATEHETKPPARFTEASLVQLMEKEGIGRPSTYASIISTIIDRGYARKQGNALVPTFTAMVVARLLSENLPQYVDLGFTSAMEKSLDEIAEGDLDSEVYLKSVYFGKTGLKEQVASQDKKIDPEKARAMSLPGLEKFSVRVGKYGAYVCRKQGKEEICASLPEVLSPSDLTAESAEQLIEQKINGADSIGEDPATGLAVYVLSGRFGPYVQLGENETSEDPKNKPKRASLPTGLAPEAVTLPQALELLSLPKTLGVHPVTKKDVKAGLGRFGPFVVCDGDYRSIPKTESVFTMDLAKALALLAQPKGAGRRGKAAPLRELGPNPTTGDTVFVHNGPYGLYVKSGTVNASLPEGVTAEAVSLDQALGLLAEKAGQEKKGRSGRSGRSPRAG